MESDLLKVTSTNEAFGGMGDIRRGGNRKAGIDGNPGKGSGKSRSLEAAVIYEAFGDLGNIGSGSKCFRNAYSCRHFGIASRFRM